MKSDAKNDYKLVASYIDSLLLFFDRGYLNPLGTTKKLNAALEPLFNSFEDLKESGEVETYEEYENYGKKIILMK